MLVLLPILKINNDSEIIMAKTLPLVVQLIRQKIIITFNYQKLFSLNELEVQINLLCLFLFLNQKPNRNYFIVFKILRWLGKSYKFSLKEKALQFSNCFQRTK